MILGFGNNVVSSLASDITSGQTSIPVFPGDGPLFAALLTSDFSNNSTELKNYAKITLTDSGETAFEVCHLLSVSGDTLTVVRGQEGTAAKGWSLKDVVANFATRGSENAFTQIAHVQSGFYTSGTAGGTANALTLNLPTTFFLNGSADWVLKTPIVVYPTQNNTGAATLQLTMGGRVLGTFKLYKGNKAELVANDILKDVALVCLLDNTKTFFNVANPGAIYAGLGTAAFRDVQTSRDDVTPGRVLVNGGALALRSVAASGGGGAYTDDCNNLPANSVSFVYGSAKNSPGFEASVLDFAGLGGAYRTQIAASYSDGGKRLKYRAMNGDNSQWGAWTSVLTNYGGTVSYLDGATYYKTNPSGWYGGGAFADQYRNNAAPFLVPYGFASVKGTSQYLPIVKGISFTEGWGYGAAVSFGILRTGNADFGSAIIQIIGDSGDGAIFGFNANGTFNAPNAIVAGGGLYDTPNVRVYSSNNPPPQQDLSPYATQSWTVANFLQGGLRLASLGVATNGNNDNEFAYAPNGTVVTAVQQKTNYTAVQYRSLQYNIGGNWYTAWVA
ncbi:hypothetical protein [Enterobacter asburiae]|uniref:hypothetical protein n=1 Tax=Enterobacter asburiae TaxID=61645 RepID=UPI00216312DD|nr:hypothetical protein [Enterobacter asburiae]MCS0625349.1 hypothetical protein [Enterobacter asburiae]